MRCAQHERGVSVECLFLVCDSAIYINIKGRLKMRSIERAGIHDGLTVIELKHEPACGWCHALLASLFVLDHGCRSLAH